MKRNIIFAFVFVFVVSMCGCGNRVRLPERIEEAAEEQNIGEVAEEKANEAAKDNTEENIEDKSEEKDSNSLDKTEEERKEYSEDGNASLSEKAENDISVGKAEDREENEGDNGNNVSFAQVSQGEEEKQVEVMEETEGTSKYTISEKAMDSDSFVTFYLTVLKDLNRNLFECERKNIYFEKEENFLTIFKQSPENEVIDLAGAYSVSAKLKEDNLTVNEGWICRKNPDFIVKLVSNGVLGAGVISEWEAKDICKSIAEREGFKDIAAVKNGGIVLIDSKLFETDYGRLVATLYLAKIMHPEEMKDVDVQSAMKQIYEELEVRYKEGLYFYCELRD